MRMKREVKFYNGYDCIKFECINNSQTCFPNSGGSHGRHGLEIAFYVHGEKGVVQFKLSTGWLPQKAQKDNIGYLNFKAGVDGSLFPMPSDLGYHAYEPHYEGQTSMGECEILGGKKCYYDGSGLNANDAFYSLLNGGSDKLFEFLEKYYLFTFEGADYPKPYEYPNKKRTV